MLAFGALLTAFYMTRQVSYVFLGHWRGHGQAHESPKVMTWPLVILAIFAILLGVIGTPIWPWFQSFLSGQGASFSFASLTEPALWILWGTSAAVFIVGLSVGLSLYGGRSPKATQPDVLESAAPLPWRWLHDRLYVDELYGVTVIAFYAWAGRAADWFDRRVWGGAVSSVAWAFRGWAGLNRFLDTYWVDGSFDKGCEEIATSGGLLARIQTGRVQTYLRILAGAVVILTVILIWSSRA